VVSKRFDGVDELLADARSRLTRVTAQTAYAEAIEQGALIVDIRPAAQRKAKGELPPSVPHLVVERNVLEWRLDPRSDARLPEASYDARVIVICQEGYQSSLAADALGSLGINATDVIDGFDAWRDAGLPVSSGFEPFETGAERPPQEPTGATRLPQPPDGAPGSATPS
jgi:rhodanese-related sulfurtransferase